MTDQQFQQQDRQAIADNYKLSPDELRALRECNIESFYYRCLPLGTIFGVSTFYAVKGGYLKPNPRWGAVPKVMAAAFAGYLLGKFSYQSACAEKIMRLPNSRLAEALRRRKGQMTFQESMGIDPGFTSVVLSGPDTDSKLQDNEYRAMDLSLDAPPRPAGLDDTYRPSLDYTKPSEESLPPVSQYATTYDELRKRNREEYEQKRNDYRKPTVQQPQQQQFPELETTPARPPSARYPPAHDPHKQKNQYGDVWEN